MITYGYNIDYLKNELNILIENKNYSLHDRDVLELSQVIDELICAYYSL